MVLVCISTMINIWIMKLIISFNNIITIFDETTLHRLRDNNIMGVKRVYVMW